MLALAGERGRLMVALRNPDDIRVTEGLSDLPTEALLNEQIRVAVGKLRQASPTPFPTPASAPAPAAPIRLPYGAQ